MGEFGTVTKASGDPVPDPLRSLFNNPDGVRIQEPPSELEDRGSMAVYFSAGARDRATGTLNDPAP